MSWNEILQLVDSAFSQIFVPLLIGFSSGWVAGKLGVKRALEQVRGERAFDRRLEWYEQAVRATMRFHSLNERTAIVVKRGDAEGLKEIINQKDEILRQFQQTVNESLVFADRAMYLRLKELASEFKNLMDETMAGLLKKQDPSITSKQYTGMVKLLEQSAFELARSTRRQLALDEITFQDFEK